jgi:hypothetical protein
MRSEAALNELLALAAALAALLAAVNSAAGATLPEQVRGQSQPGGARIPGTSFELAPAAAAEAMVALLQDYRDATFAQRFAETLAQADAASRAAPGHGQTGPLIAEVLAVCSTGLARPTDEMHSTALVPPMEAALAELATSLITQFRPDEANRVLACFANPVALAAMPVRDFMALLVRL